MARTYAAIDGRLAEFVLAQPVFFVATAPSGPEGHVNCSPKGGDGTFAVLGPRSFGYLDMTGSGVETIAHLQDNGRIVVMFCSFGVPPRIVRLHGRGEVVEPGDPRFDGLSGRFPAGSAGGGGTGRGGTGRGRAPLGARAVVVVDVQRISDSCGYGVPLMDFVGHRDAMDRWASQKGSDGVAAYQAEKNALSLDGLPGLAGPRGDPRPVAGEPLLEALTDAGDR